MNIKEKMRVYAIKQLDKNIDDLVCKLWDEPMYLEALHTILTKHLDSIEYSLVYEDDVDE